MFYVTKKYSKPLKRCPVKVVGHTVERTISSFADWNKQEFGHNWVTMMAWNWACLREEGGGRTSSATANALVRKFHKISYTAL